MGIRMREGRDFNRNISGDATGALLLNEEALRKLGWPSGTGEPIEAFFKESGKIEPAFQATVVGVVKDFNFRDLTALMQELLIKISQGRFEYILIRFDGKRLAASLAYIRQVWQEFQFNQPFDFTFLDSDIEAVYRSYVSFTSIVSYATLLAILIACLGLIGLSAFMAENRSKEIGIRKVFGASVQGIVFMLSKEYLKLVLLANVIAWPAAYFLLSKLLQWFPYHITIGIWTFLLSGILALAIALITVSYQSIKAALANPVESLRYE